MLARVPVKRQTAEFYAQTYCRVTTLKHNIKDVFTISFSSLLPSKFKQCGDEDRRHKYYSVTTKLEKKISGNSEYRKNNNFLVTYLMEKLPCCTQWFQPGGRSLFPDAEHKAPLPWAELQPFRRHRHSAPQLSLDQ